MGSLIGLYDQTGMLRFAGRDQADCLAYAELFALAEDSFSLESLQAEGLPLAALERSDLL